MNEPLWILDKVVIAVHQMLIAEHGGSAGIRDQGLLESALARPKQLYVYKEHVSIFELAASYGFGLARNHAFVDGNKRITLAIMGVFLEFNHYSLDAPEPEAVIVIEQLAGGYFSEEQLAQWLSDHSYQIEL